MTLVEIITYLPRAAGTFMRLTFTDKTNQTPCVARVFGVLILALYNVLAVILFVWQRKNFSLPDFSTGESAIVAAVSAWIWARGRADQ